MLEFEYQVAEKRIEAGRLHDQLLKTEVEIDEAKSLTVEAEKLVDELQGEVGELSTVRSELEGHVAKLTEEAKVISKKAVEDFMASEAFMDEVNESALNIFLKGFDECHQQLHLLYPDLDLRKLRREFLNED